MSRSRTPAVHSIEIKLRELGQLFNSIDPSPFNERDLDHDAEEFIVSWALEAPADAAIKLVVHLSQPPAATAGQVAESVQHYFRYRAGITRNELRELLREGRRSLRRRPGLPCGLRAGQPGCAQPRRGFLGIHRS